MAQKIGWYSAALLLYFSPMQCKEQPIVLESVIIKLMDGASFGVSGYEVKLMLHILLKLNHMLDGEPDQKGNVQGLYQWEQAKYSIKQLAQQEFDLDYQWFTYQKNNAPLRSQEEQYLQTKRSFKQCLDSVKKDFDHKVSPFLANARGSKQQLLILIKESCEKHGNPQSHLLKWGEAEDGHETTAMYTDIHTFKEFEIFCQDLANFIKDLLHSCPKAVAQYKELKASYSAAHPSTFQSRS